MSQQEWENVFQASLRSDLGREDPWRLEFDDTLVPKNPEPGWKEYIKNTAGRFKCSTCGRGWPSNKVMLLFHMRLQAGKGVLKVRRFRQNCKTCSGAPMEKPNITPENINITMENVVKKIRIKCYHDDLGEASRPFVNLEVKSPHEPTHCEACMKGICRE